MSDAMQWLEPRDRRFDWLNVADWEPRGDGLQPVRVTKAWRDQWPKKTARRAMSSAGMAVRFRTDSKKLVFRVTFVDAPDTPPATPAAGWERSRPNFFSLYRDGKYVASMAGLTHFEASGSNHLQRSRTRRRGGDPSAAALLLSQLRGHLARHRYRRRRAVRARGAGQTATDIFSTATPSLKAMASPARGKPMSGKLPSS